MTPPIRSLVEAYQRLNQYQIEDRPLNLDESRELRDLIQLVITNSQFVIPHMKRQRLPPAVGLAVSTIENAIG